MLRRLMILAMAMLLSACDSGASTASPLGAAEVGFDSDDTALKGATVQAFGEALDKAVGATDAQLRIVLTRLEALEGERDALKARATALEDANDSLEARLAVLEGTEPQNVDVLGTQVTGATLPGGTVLSTLENIHTTLAGLAGVSDAQVQIEGRVQSVEEAVAGLSACPQGTMAVGEFCVDSAPRVADLWDSAVFRCAESGGHMCTADEYSAACQTPPALAGGEGLPQLTSELVMGPGGYAGAALLFDAELCGAAGDPVDAGALHPYRCCYHRVVPGAGPPNPTN